jgi:hypothetical protein
MIDAGDGLAHAKALSRSDKIYQSLYPTFPRGETTTDYGYDFLYGDRLMQRAYQAFPTLRQSRNNLRLLEPHVASNIAPNLAKNSRKLALFDTYKMSIDTRCEVKSRKEHRKSVDCQTWICSGRALHRKWPG